MFCQLYCVRVQEYSPNYYWRCITATHRDHVSDKRCGREAHVKVRSLPMGNLVRSSDGHSRHCLLILLRVDTRIYTWLLLFLVAGLGHGLVLMSLNFSVKDLADTQQVAYAAAMYICMRTLGIVAVGRSVFQNELRKQFDDLRLPTGGEIRCCS